MTTDASPPPDETSGGEGASEAPRRRGRPTKLTPELVKKVEEGLSVGLSPELASERAGITRRTYALWKAKGEQDERDDVESDERDFFHTVTQTRAEFAYDAAKWLKDNRDTPSKETSSQTVLFMLERRHPEDFGRREAVELSGPNGGAIQVQTLEDAIAAAGAGGDDKA